MVKAPEKAPYWQSLLQKKPEIALKFQENSAMKTLIEKTDRHYYYWDKIRSQPLPKEFNKEEVWAYLRLRRMMSSGPAPLTDIKGRSFTFWTTDEMQKNLYQIDQDTASRFDFWDHGYDKEVRTKFLVMSLMEEAITSSQIEGAVSTIKDAKKMLLEKRAPRNTSEQMIFNNYHTMQLIKTVCKKELTLQVLLELHALITKDTLETKEEEGTFRTARDDINVVTDYGEILFTPPSAEEIPERIFALLQFANDGNHFTFIHPIVKAIMLHFWMAYIHPFTDGNGRMARTLFYWYMLKHDYWLFEYTSISKTILKKTTQYANAYLYSEHDDNDLTYFIHFHLNVIMEAVEELKKHIEEERKNTQRLQQDIDSHPDLNLRQIRILEHIQTHPHDVLTIKIHQNLNQIAYQTARTDLLQLVEKGWLKSIGKGKAFYFVSTKKGSVVK